MSFYLAAADDLLRRDYMAPSIGLILCKARDGLLVEYALRDIASPIGVAEYRLALPPDLAGRLPTPDQILAGVASREQPSPESRGAPDGNVPDEEDSDGGAAAPERP